MAQVKTLDPVAVPRGQGDARWWMGNLAEIKVTAAETGGLLTVVEITEGPGAGGPLHVHHREDEAFWILEGSATFEVGEEVIEAGPGDFLFGPRDVPHRYTAGPDGCRMLFVFTPGGFEELLLATSEAARERTLPPPSAEEPDFEALLPIIHKYGCEVLG
ncbi:MAG TPA: cupin domain-containing protein [Actinomycetota bacterium]|nr:cupin domain-containing protein [Actinomycetota bacterium]